MIYRYRAKKDPQNTVEGKIEARSEKEAVEKISLLGYLPVHVEEDSGAGQGSAAPGGVFFSRIKSREVTVFTRELASLLKSGVPILRSIDIISEQSESSGIKAMFRSIYNSIKDGATLSSSFARYPAVFSSLYIAMIRIGEDSGSLPEVLLRIADYRAKQEEMLSRFRMALAYPILMAVVGASTIIFMLTFVMPRLMKIYVTMQQALPMPTRILIAVSDGLRLWWHWVIIGLIVVIFVIKKELNTSTGRMSLSLFQLRTPLVGKFILKAEFARFSRTLELLLRSGIPILKALDISIPVLGNEVMKGVLKNSYKELEQGGSFGRSLKNAKIFPVFMSNLIAVGEESGKLADAFAEVSSAYERDTDEAMRVMANLLEPVMILVMGLAVGFIVMAMLLPRFEINVFAR